MLLFIAACQRPSPPPAVAGFDVAEASIAQLQGAMRAGRVTSREIVAQYLGRIATYEQRYGATIAVNPRALEEAEALDRERALGKVRGPLHGVPIALKDNIQATGMPMSGGALAFENFLPPFDATLTANLRAAGAVIIAKTSLTELANWVAGPPTSMPGNYSSVRGHGLNPYDSRPDPRAGSADGRGVLRAGGSSSGIGTALSFWTANVGTETSGSLLSPANQTMLVAIKPTTGRVSRHGVMPITSDRDTPGPMARTVADAAILLAALAGGGADAHDAATTRCPPVRDYTPHLRRDGLRGARIGIPRAFFYDAARDPRGAPGGGLDPPRAAVMAAAMRVLVEHGAVLVEPADIPSVVEPRDAFNPAEAAICLDRTEPGCSTVLAYGFKRDFNAWLDTLGAAAPVHSLAALRAWNTANAARGTLRYGQSLLDYSDTMDLQRDRARYEADLARDHAASVTRGIEAVVRAQRLDALLFPAVSGAAIAARAGYPSIIVPFGTVPNAPLPPLPDDFAARPEPFGVTFTGLACAEPRLVELGFAFEQATLRRVPPPSPR